MGAGETQSVWSLWLNMNRVSLDDAVALSLGLDPKSIERQSVLNPRGFPSKQHKAEYEDRLEVSVSHLGNEKFFRSQGMASRRNPLRLRPIFLTDFVKLAKHCEWSLPAELGAIAENANAGEQLTPVPAGAQIVGAGETATGKVAQQKQETCEPFLQPNSRNSRAAVDQWVRWQAQQMVKTTDTMADIAARIFEIAGRWGYQSERRPMTIASITKMLPPGLTGGRGKNKGIRGKNQEE